MRFNLLLTDAGVEPGSVALMFHTPREAALRRALPWLAAERPDLFNAYQNNHKRREEATLRRRRWSASFVAGAGTDMVFAGLFEVGASTQWHRADYAADPAQAELAALAGVEHAAWVEHFEPEGRLVFDLRSAVELADLVGRVVVGRPTGRAYMRLAENLALDVLELSRDSRLVPAPPEWRELAVTGAQVRALPRSWAARLAEWRGIYLIVDEADGQRYVGSAYGAENLLGRWHAHAAGDRGVTAELRHRDPAAFRFSILERVSPDMIAEDVVRLEQTWMDRLHTRRFGLNAGAPAVAEQNENN